MAEDEKDLTAAETVQPEIVDDTPAADSFAENPKGKTKKPRMTDQYMVLPVRSYFWTMFVFFIPVLRPFVCLLISLGASRYRNKINFARASLIMMILQLIVWGLIALAAWLMIGYAGNSIDQFLTSTGVGYPTDLTNLSEWLKKLESLPSVHQYLQNLNESLKLQ